MLSPAATTVSVASTEDASAEDASAEVSERLSVRNYMVAMIARLHHHRREVLARCPGEYYLGQVHLCEVLIEELEFDLKFLNKD